MTIDGYRAEPYRFIVKPFTEKQIFDLLDDCFKKMNKTVGYIKIISESLCEQIRVDKVLYIYSKSRKRHVICSNREITTWQTLQELMAYLLPEKFAYSQKSFIVNLNEVDTIRNDSIVLSSGKIIPIGEHYK